MLFTLKAPLYGRLYLRPEQIGNTKAVRDDVQVELRTSRRAEQPGMAVLVDEIAMTIRVPYDELDRVIPEAGCEPMPNGALTLLKER